MGQRPEGSTADGGGRDLRHQNAIRAGGAECSMTRHIGNVHKWPEVAWCTSM